MTTMHTMGTGRTKRLIVLMAAALAVSLSVGQAQGSSARAMFDEAVHLQEVKGDLQKAMTIYREIAERHADDAVAPKALLELAGCYEKLGRPEATEVYRQIVTKYAGSGAAAAAAKAKLGSAQKVSVPENRRLWTEGVERVSPDGKYVTFTDWVNGDLAIREVGSGRIRKLTANGPARGGPAEYDYAEAALPSPDSSRIAYSWQIGKTQRSELRVIERNGGAPRTFHTPAAGNTRVVGWFPDGKHVMASSTSGTAPNIRTNLFKVPLDGGAAAQVSGFAFEGAGAIWLSPDGRFVAFDLPAEGKRERDIHVFSVTDGKSWPIVRHLANDRMLDWFPSGDRLLFSSDRGGTYGIWQLNLVDGRPRGEAELVQGNVDQPWAAGITRNGEFFHVQSTRESVVQVVSIDPATKKQTAAPSQLQGRFVGGQTHGVWSPDGQKIAYVQATRFGAAETGARLGGAASARRLAIHTLATGDVRLLDLGMPNLNNPSWSPDGRAIVLQGQGVNADGQATQGLFRVELSTGALSPVATRDATAPDPNRSLPVFTADGRAVFFRRYRGARAAASAVGASELLRLDLATGVEQAMTTNLSAFALSRDGRWLAIRPSGLPAQSVIVMPSTGGQGRTLLTGADWTLGNPIEWSHDGRSLYVVKAVDTARQVWVVPAEGGAPVDTGIRIKGVLARISAHPDGRQLAISTDVVGTETWVLSNLNAARK